MQIASRDPILTDAGEGTNTNMLHRAPFEIQCTEQGVRLSGVFQNNQARKGGAIGAGQLQNMLRRHLNKFLQNEAREMGGALYL